MPPIVQSFSYAGIKPLLSLYKNAICRLWLSIEEKIINVKKHKEKLKYKKMYENNYMLFQMSGSGGNCQRLFL
jgi:tRNA G26 N,N-dimethylase Trm1